MSLESLAPHSSRSNLTDGFLEIIRQLGFWLEAVTGVNPDAGYSSFSAANYNHGNNTETEDLLEEIIIRLDEINANSPGGGGGEPQPDLDEKVKSSSSDAQAAYLLEKFVTPAQGSQIAFEEVSGPIGKAIRLISNLASNNSDGVGIGVNQNIGLAKILVEAVNASLPWILVRRGAQNIFRSNESITEFWQTAGFRVLNGSSIIFAVFGNQGIQILPGQGVSSTYVTAADVQADTNLATGRVVILQNGTLVRKM